MNQLDLFTFDTPAMPKLDLSRCYTKPINYETAAKMVKKYHYAHRVPSIVMSIGMYVDSVLAGCITYGIPPNRNVLLCCGEEFESRALELNRLFIHDWAGRNSESWLIGQSFKWLQNTTDYVLLISYADPEHDHTGYIYQATNWLYTGTGAKSKSDVFVNGRKISEKHLFNLYGTRRREKLRSMGLKIQDIISEGKHRYVYFLGTRRQRRELRRALKWPVLPYPK
jgi:hypothetical protein